MTQLILDTMGNNIVLPESQKGGYQCYRDDLGDEVEMITGRVVREIRGTVWRVSYQYGYFDESTRIKLMESCEKGRKTPITCSFLHQESTDLTLKSSNFYVESFTRPKFMWSTNEEGDITPMWADFSIELREVQPSD
jgi:hypothetical protein